MNLCDLPPEIQALLNSVDEKVRKTQQGLGKRIVSCIKDGRRFVRVGDELYETKHDSFHLFLIDYVRSVIGNDWMRCESSKPLGDQHKIVQWYNSTRKYSKDNREKAPIGEIFSLPMVGVAESCLRLSYNLYLLAHNTINDAFDKKTQEELITRLKNKDESNFLGVLHETYVCAMLVNAGFEVDLVSGSARSDEKYDFYATCKSSRQSYAVEAKAVAGDSGLTQDKRIKRVVRQIRCALKKRSEPGRHRMIFIEAGFPYEGAEQERQWVDEVLCRVRDMNEETIKASNCTNAEPAHIIVTSHPYRHHPEEVTMRTAFATSYKIEGYKHDGAGLIHMWRWRTEQRHIGILTLMESIENHDCIPARFDGKIPDAAEHARVAKLTMGSYRMIRIKYSQGVCKHTLEVQKRRYWVL